MFLRDIDEHIPSEKQKESQENTSKKLSYLLNDLNVVGLDSGGILK